MSKIAPAILAVMLAASPLVLPQPARAENGEIAAGVVGGLIGGRKGVGIGALVGAGGTTLYNLKTRKKRRY